jgi:hypothetical protein
VVKNEPEPKPEAPVPGQFEFTIPAQPYTDALLQSRLVTARKGESFAWYEPNDWKARIRAKYAGQDNE